MSTRVARPVIRRKGRTRVGTPADVAKLHELTNAGGWECEVRDQHTAERLRQWVLREGRRIERLYHTTWHRSDGILRVEPWVGASVPIVDAGRMGESATIPAASCAPRRVLTSGRHRHHHEAAS